MGLELVFDTELVLDGKGRGEKWVKKGSRGLKRSWGTYSLMTAPFFGFGEEDELWSNESVKIMLVFSGRLVRLRFECDSRDASRSSDMSGEISRCSCSDSLALATGWESGIVVGSAAWFEDGTAVGSAGWFDGETTAASAARLEGDTVVGSAAPSEDGSIVVPATKGDWSTVGAVATGAAAGARWLPSDLRAPVGWVARNWTHAARCLGVIELSPVRNSQIELLI